MFCAGSLFNRKIRTGMIGRFRSYQDLKSFRVRIGIEKLSIGSTRPPMGNLSK